MDPAAVTSPEWLALAQRLGASRETPPSVVRLTQVGTMQRAPRTRSIRFRARQVIDLRRPAFRWRAVTGPLGIVSVSDIFENASAVLEVRALRVLSFARVRGPAAVKGAAIRYLAELAWAPDAMLQNPALRAQAIDHATLRVGLPLAAGNAEIELRLDAEGRIASAFARDRPRQEGSLFIQRPWRGRFFDYRRHLSRWIPFQAEAEWIIDGRSFVAWRGEITGWVAG